jgi:hypothetical protein
MLTNSAARVASERAVVLPVAVTEQLEAFAGQSFCTTCPVAGATKPSRSNVAKSVLIALIR